jgi:hypothetical protein
MKGDRALAERLRIKQQAILKVEKRHKELLLYKSKPELKNPYVERLKKTIKSF